MSLQERWKANRSAPYDMALPYYTCTMVSGDDIVVFSHIATLISIISSLDKPDLSARSRQQSQRKPKS